MNQQHTLESSLSVLDAFNLSNLGDAPQQPMIFPQREINLPFKKPNKKQIINLVEKLDLNSKVGGVSGVLARAEIENNTRREDKSSRSGSIQGRKLSFCDPQITVSQHTLDNRHSQDGSTTYRDRETLQRLSAAALMPIMSIQPQMKTPSQQQHQQEGGITIVTLEDRKSLQTLQGNILGTSRRGNHNPRQSKEKSVNGAKKKLRKSIGQQAQLNANIRHQHAIKPHIQRPTSSLSKNNHSVSLHTDNIPSKSPSRERRSGMSHSNSQGNLISRKQLISRASGKSNPSGFQLTFNNKVLSPAQVAKLQQKLAQANAAEQPLPVQMKQRPKTAMNYQISRQDIYQQAAQNAQVQQSHSHSASPVKAPRSSSKPRSSSSNHKLNSHRPYQQRQASPIPQSPEQYKEEERLLKEQLRRQIERSKEKVKQREVEKEQEKNKKREFEEGNKKIRERNRLSNEGNKNKDMPMRKSIDKQMVKNPSAAVLRNINAPQLIENREKMQKKKYDLGMEIFELKKELGLPSHRNIRDSHRSRSAGKRAHSSESPEQQRTCPQTTERGRDSKRHAVSHSPNRERNTSSKKRKKHQGDELKKLIQKQQKMWIKKIRQQEIGEIMLQQKVINNLKQLNIVVEQKRIMVKKHKPTEKEKQFKTVDENMPPKASDEIKKKTKSIAKDVVVNIQVRPENYDNILQIRNSMDNNHPATTKEQQSKSFIKLKAVQKTKKKPSPDDKKPKKQQIIDSRPKTADFNVKKLQFNKKSLKQDDSSVSHLQNKMNLHKQHQSILTNRTEKPMKTRKSSKEKQNKSIIIQLMKQIQLQQQQIDELRQNLIDKPKRRSQSKEKVKTSQPLQHEVNTQRLEQRQQQVPPSRQAVREESDKVIIEDERMIIKVLNTAASLIQNQFRQFISKKRLQQHQFEHQNIHEESKIESEQLSESLKLEDRILPVLKEVQHSNKRQNDEGAKRGGKHTFSFGHGQNEEQKQQKHVEKKKIIDQIPQHTEPIVQEEFKIQPHSSKSSNQKIQNSNDQQISLILDSSHNYSIKQQKESEKQQSSIKTSKEEENKEQSALSSGPLMSNRSSQSSQIQKAIKINDNVKFALRNLAEKQKKNNIFEMLQKNKKQQKQMKPASVLDQELPVNEDSFLRSINKDQGILKNSEDDQQFIDLSKLTLDIDDVPASINRSKDMPRQMPVNTSNVIQIDNQQSISSMVLDDQMINNSSNQQQVSLKDLIGSSKQQDSKSYIDEDYRNYSNRLAEDEAFIHETEVGPLETDFQNDEYDDNQIIEIPQMQSNLLIQRQDQQILPKKPHFDYLSVNPNLQPNRQMIGMLDRLFPSNHHDFSVPDSPRSHSDNHFLQTNASLFERNPFKEFTTNRINEMLQSKNTQEVSVYREQALEYHEKLQKSLINRLEQRKEISPSSAQRRKYELERWLSNERKPAIEHNQGAQNIFQLDLQKHQVAQIIQTVNAKAKEARHYIHGKPSSSLGGTPSQAIHSKDLEHNHAQNYINTHHSVQSSQPLEEQKSAQQQNQEMIDLTLDEDINQQQSQPLVTLNLDDIIFDSKNQQPELEISIEVKDMIIHKDEPTNEQKYSKQADELCNEIMKEILIKEIQSMTYQRNEDPIQVEPEKQFDTIESSQYQEFLEEQKQEKKQEQISLIHKPHSSIDSMKSLEQNIDEIQNLVDQSDKPESSIPEPTVSAIQNEIFSQQPIKDEIQQQQVNEEEHKQDQTILKCEYSLEFLKEQLRELEEKQNNDKQQESVIQLGIDTSEQAIDQYIEEIFDQIRPRKEQFLQAFITPIYKNPLEILAHLQRPDFGQAGDDSNNPFNLLDATNSLAYILNVQLYLTLEKAKENIIHETIEQLRKQAATAQALDDDMADLMSEAQHIHNKVIFDCVNESLNFVRPYASHGEPMPWSRKPRRNLIFMFESADDLDHILVNVKNTVVQWAKTRAGALPPPNKKGEEDPQTVHIRERALAQMLAQELMREEDNKWLDYEMEEAQVKIDLSDIVLEHLVGETVQMLNDLQEKRRNL